VAKLNNEPFLNYVGMMLNSTSFQNLLVLSEAQDIAFEQSLDNWRSFPPQSSIGMSGAAREAEAIFFARNKFGVSERNG
jgi:hypothetical protein